MEKKQALFSCRCGVLTLSDRACRGEREDTSGPRVAALLRAQGLDPVMTAILPDEEELIVRLLLQWVDEHRLDLIVTTGGTGISPRDRTPEATRQVIEREVPGLAEVMRMASLRITPQAVWSRAVAGIRGQCLILNLPGSKKAAEENIQAVLPVLGHGLAVLQAQVTDCGQPLT